MERGLKTGSLFSLLIKVTEVLKPCPVMKSFQQVLIESSCESRFK